MTIRAHSITNILNKKYNLIPFSGPWLDAFGQPERGGLWYISGRSTNGKTAFCLQLVKELALLNLKTALFSFEEATSKTLQDSLLRVGMADVRRRVIILELAPFDEVVKWLKTKRLSVVMIDTIQKWKIKPRDLEKLSALFPSITFIVVSHVKDNGMPDGAAAIQALRDASLKIWIEGFRAISKGRYFGRLGYFTIWEEGANEYWAQNI